jgi:hypothetical protein
VQINVEYKTHFPAKTSLFSFIVRKRFAVSYGLSSLFTLRVLGKKTAAG